MVERDSFSRSAICALSFFYLRDKVFHLGIKRRVLHPGAHERIDAHAQVGHPFMHPRFECQYLILPLSLIRQVLGLLLNDDGSFLHRRHALLYALL